MAAPDLSKEGGIAVYWPAYHAAAVTPADATDLAFLTRAIYVGGAGNLSVLMQGGEIVTFVAVAAGTTLQVRADRVRLTGTTATSILALW